MRSECTAMHCRREQLLQRQPCTPAVVLEDADVDEAGVAPEHNDECRHKE